MGRRSRLDSVRAACRQGMQNRHLIYCGSRLSTGYPATDCVERNKLDRRSRPDYAMQEARLRTHVDTRRGTQSS